jgi:adenosylmethionine-8-amino-7-oxononanoate aminotransferase
MIAKMNDWIQKDREWIWHPYSQHGLNQAILPVVSAKGAYLVLKDGREILDGISSWWVNLHGHSHPEIADAIQKQANHLEHVIFSGFSHEPAVELAGLILNYPSIQKAGLRKAFYSDNGSTAVEVALKMAFQYHINRGNRKRTRFLALKNSYHGDTLGAMAVSEPDGFHQFFKPILPPVDFFEPGDLTQLQALLKAHPGEYAAFIFEPLIQGAGGMRIYSSDFLDEAVALCRQNEILTIADEVFTGFYRTGKCFAFEHSQISPDLVCLSKGITGGFLPLAVTLATEEIYAAFLSDEIRTAFLHGHSYTANPISCAAGVASWNLLQTPECLERIQQLVQVTREEILRLQKKSRVKLARSLGTIGAIELESSMNYFSSKTTSVLKFSLERNVLLRPLGNVIYTVPPYCCTPEELRQIYQVMDELVSIRA